MTKVLDAAVGVLMLPLYLFFAAWGTAWLLWDIVRGRPTHWHDEEEDGGIYRV